MFLGRSNVEQDYSFAPVANSSDVALLIDGTHLATFSRTEALDLMRSGMEALDLPPLGAEVT